MYIPTLAYQTNVFLMCIGFGFLLGVFYHTVCFFRKAFLIFKKAVVVQDILFCIFSTFLIFCFLLCCNDGEIRMFTFAGIALGFVIYYYTFGVFVARVINKAAAFFRKRIILICRLNKKIFVYGKKICKKLKIFFKKTEINENTP